MFNPHLKNKHSRQAVEVSRPSATLELTIKTAMTKGTAIPKGRLTWPREAKPRPEERIIVFAEGRQADEAKRAGAHVVGGLELIDDVRSPSTLLNSHFTYSVHTKYFLDRERTSQSDHRHL